MTQLQKQKVIATDLPNTFEIKVRFYKSKAYGYEGQEFASVTVEGGKRYTDSIQGKDGLTDCLAAWLEDQTKDNPTAQAVLQDIYDAAESYSGYESLVKEDDHFSIMSAGENSVMQLFKKLGLKLKTLKSSTRRNAFVIGFKVVNEGIEITTQA